MEDASLSDFLDAADAEATDEPRGDSEAADDGEGSNVVEEDSESDGSPDAAAGGGDSADVGPATTTYAWSPEGRACQTCGEAAPRLWRDGDALVCPACKEW